MNRANLHTAATGQALLAAAEELAAAGGLEAISVRTAAARAGTTTRAVYSLFGSKDGLVDGLAARAYRVIERELDEHPRTDDPVEDLVLFAVDRFRPFVLEHTVLFRIAFQRLVPDLRVSDELLDARRRSMLRFRERLQRLQDRGLLGDKTIQQATFEYNAMCQGLANIELGGNIVRAFPEGGEDAVWRAAFSTLVRAFREPSGLPLSRAHSG